MMASRLFPPDHSRTYLLPKRPRRENEAWGLSGSCGAEGQTNAREVL